MTKLIGVLLGITLLAGCGTEKSATSAADPDAVLSAIHEVENFQIDAITRRDLRSATNIYTPNVQFHIPGSGLDTGREEIFRRLEDMLADESYDLQIDSGSRQSWVANSGDLAATGFSGNMTRTETGKPVTFPMINRTIWVKQHDGSWQIDSDINTRLSMPSK